MNSINKKNIYDEWIPITLESSLPDCKQFLLSDEYGFVYVGSTCFDFYDAKFWFPMPKYPIGQPYITNDKCISLLLNRKDEK